MKIQYSIVFFSVHDVQISNFGFSMFVWTGQDKHISGNTVQHVQMLHVFYTYVWAGLCNASVYLIWERAT